MAKEKFCGIYKITTIHNGKVYIGQSNNVYKRWSQHLSEFREDKHHNPYLQKVFNKYGVENLIFEILETCSESDLNIKEIYYINLYESFSEGYNMTLGGDGRRGYKLTKEQIQNIKNGRKNFKHSEETKKKISKIQIGRKLSDEWKENISKHHKQAIKSGEMIPNIKNLIDYIERCKKAIKVYDKNGYICSYPDIHSAARELNLEATNICKVLKNKFKTCGKFTFCYENESLTQNDLLNKYTLAKSNNRHTPYYNPIIQIDKDGSILKEFDSVKNAAKEYGLDDSSICKVCRGKLKQTKGYIFRYKE